MSDPEDQAIDVTIEALTGTVYDLCVSPYETILGIKLKIQRLEGIPVYQQQLVYGGVELQDDFCLEEHGIQSGAQLKLLIAMRGGPIHAHRVHIEEPTLWEIAELLDRTEGSDHRYTVMLLRDGDALDVADFVQMYNEDGCESVSCSPVQVSESHASKATQTEHALTRDKMRELMAKLKRLRTFRKYQQPVGATPSGPQLQRKGTAKVLILDSRASSRLVPSSGPSPLPPQPSEHRMSAQRRLVFSSEDCTCCQATSRGVTKRARSPEMEETPVISRKHRSRVEELRGREREGVGCSRREWRRAAKRMRRGSCVDSGHVAELQARDPLGELATQVSRLSLGPRGVGEGGREEGRVCVLPQIPSAHRHTSSLRGIASRKGLGKPGPSYEPLPSLPLPTTTTTAAAIVKQSKRRSRCMQCGKKMGLATTYTCRCGGLFCAIHRYAETHTCTFDYKAEGRQMITRNNPVVMAPKLPKI